LIVLVAEWPCPSTVNVTFAPSAHVSVNEYVNVTVSPTTEGFGDEVSPSAWAVVIPNHSAAYSAKAAAIPSFLPMRRD
jgi:hypothetical protein